jgi:hypothetical protein
VAVAPAVLELLAFGGYDALPWMVAGRAAVAPAPCFIGARRAGVAQAARRVGRVAYSRHLIARRSGHNIQDDQPQLVLKVIGDVVEAVRHPAGWTTH